jgi:hypothetical protein
MTYDVIAAFIDRRTGNTVEAGSPVPAGLDRHTIKRLVKARCLAPIEKTGEPAVAQSAAPSLFPEDDQASDGEGEPESSSGPAGATPPAGSGRAKK